MKKRIILTILLVLAFLYFATLFYKVIIVMLLVTVWKNKIRENLPGRVNPWGMKAIWICLALTLWVAMPRYRIHSGDRVRLVYLDEQGNARHAPLLHYAANTLLPEEEVVNFGITNLRLVRPVLQIFKMNLGTTFINQAVDDFKAGKLTNFFKPYRRLGLENPMSGVYPQFFNQCLGGDSRAVYICDPKGGKVANEYPLVVFCHGYLGNWQLYQGIWKDLEDCIVLSIGTKDLRGIFSQSDIKSIFDFYIPALERMGYSIDKDQIHLMGLSNGGSAVSVAMHSPFARKFRSLTSISCNIDNLRSVPCQVNLIGGGKDASANRMPSECRQLKSLGVDAALYFDETENHYILVNQREGILTFLKERMQLKCGR